MVSNYFLRVATGAFAGVLVTGATALAGVLAAGTAALETGAAVFAGVLATETGINLDVGAAFVLGVGCFAGGRAANGFTALALMMAV